MFESAFQRTSSKAKQQSLDSSRHSVRTPECCRYVVPPGVTRGRPSRHFFSKSACRYIYVLILCSMVSTLAAANDTLHVLECEVSGPPGVGGEDRVIRLVITPPQEESRGNLWHLNEDHEPGQVVSFGSAIGTVHVNYGGYEEQRDLIFQSVGHPNGSSHVAFWLREGVMQHAAFIVVDIWDERIPINMLDASQSQPLLRGNCSTVGS